MALFVDLGFVRFVSESTFLQPPACPVQQGIPLRSPALQRTQCGASVEDGVPYPLSGAFGEMISRAVGRYTQLEFE